MTKSYNQPENQTTENRYSESGGEFFIPYGTENVC